MDTYVQGYQFWTQADKTGHFMIKNVMPGDYNLFAWLPGFIGDYKYNKIITITPGTIFCSFFLLGLVKPQISTLSKSLALYS